MNIILVGHIGSGKTSVGKKLAKIINSDFVDIDDLISNLHSKLKKEKLSVQDIFKKYGEEYFRTLEKKAVKKVIHMKNCIISTGGGTLEDKENAEILKKNGKIIFLEVDIDILAERARNQPSRPIFKGIEPITALKKMNEKRTPIFKQFSEVIIDASSNSVDETLSRVMEVI